MANKTKKTGNENILYIQDVEAKVLGIIEGSAQKVYIDNKEVDVVYVDEHEVIPATADEKKLYQDAHKIASNYTSIYHNEGKALKRSIVGYSNPFKSSTIERKNQKEVNENSFINKFKEKIELIRTKLVKDKKEKATNNKNLFGKNNDKYLARNDAFTREELDIVRDILANKTQASTKTATAVNSKELTTVKKAPAKTAVTTKAKKK